MDGCSNPWFEEALHCMDAGYLWWTSIVESPFGKGLCIPWAAGTVIVAGLIGAVNRAATRAGSKRRDVGRAVTMSTHPTASPGGESGALACPRCGSAVKRRTARRGASAGEKFWGCSEYPKCAGRRPV